MNKTNLRDIAYTGKQFMYRLGVETLDLLVRYTRAGIDVYGKQFAAYSRKYRERKGAGKIPRQSSLQTNPVDLTLTGDLLNNAKVHEVFNDGVRLGWADQQSVDKLKSNERVKGRRIVKTVGFPFNKKVEKNFNKRVVNKIEDNINSTKLKKRIKVNIRLS